MDTDVRKITNEKIVAIACLDRKGRMHISHLGEEVLLKYLDFQEDQIVVGKLHIPLVFFDEIIVCTQEILDDIKRKL